MSGKRAELSSRKIEYLISIFQHSKKKGYARQYELIDDLGVSKPTASLMVKKLKDSGYVKVHKGKIMLNDEGERVIQEILWKHGVIESALVRLGLSHRRACEISWKIIQEIPKETARKIWKKLGSPSHCPCGYSLPSLDGRVNITCYEACLTYKQTAIRRPEPP